MSLLSSFKPATLLLSRISSRFSSGSTSYFVTIFQTSPEASFCFAALSFVKTRCLLVGSFAQRCDTSRILLGHLERGAAKISQKAIAVFLRTYLFYIQGSILWDKLTLPIAYTDRTLLLNSRHNLTQQVP